MQGRGRQRDPSPSPTLHCHLPLPDPGTGTGCSQCETLAHGLRGFSERVTFGELRVSATGRLAIGAGFPLGPSSTLTVTNHSFVPGTVRNLETWVKLSQSEVEEKLSSQSMGHSGLKSGIEGMHRCEARRRGP